MKIRELLEGRDPYDPVVDSGISDIDYANRGRRSYRDPEDYFADRDEELHPMVRAEIEAERRREQYNKKFKAEQDWQEGTAPNGKDYNLRYVVTSDDPTIIRRELDKFENSHDYYMRKLVDTEIQTGQGIGYYMDRNSWNVPVKPRKS